MRRTRWIAVTLLVVLAAVAVAVGAYNAGLHHGLVQGAGDRVVRVVDGRFGHGWGWGFFPFGLFFFPFFLFLIFGVFRWAFWGRGWGHHPHGPYGGPGNHPGGPWREDPQDWHRRQHEPGQGDRGSEEPPAVA